MPPTTSRLLRVVLRLIVLVQLASLAMVGFTLSEIVYSGNSVSAAAAALTAAMAVLTLVALGVTFRLEMPVRRHLLVFMFAQVAVAMLPLAGRAALSGIAATGSPMSPAEAMATNFVLGTIALALLFAAGLAAVSALLAPLLLGQAPSARSSR